MNTNFEITHEIIEFAITNGLAFDSDVDDKQFVDFINQHPDAFRDDISGNNLHNYKNNFNEFYKYNEKTDPDIYHKSTYIGLIIAATYLNKKNYKIHTTTDSTANYTYNNSGDICVKTRNVKIKGKDFVFISGYIDAHGLEEKDYIKTLFRVKKGTIPYYSMLVVHNSSKYFVRICKKIKMLKTLNVTDNEIVNDYRHEKENLLLNISKTNNKKIELQLFDKDREILLGMLYCYDKDELDKTIKTFYTDFKILRTKDKNNAILKLKNKITYITNGMILINFYKNGEHTKNLLIDNI